MQADAAGNAANASLMGTQQGINAQRAQQGLAQGYQQPFYNTGLQANSRLSALLGLGGGNGNAMQWAMGAGLDKFKADQGIGEGWAPDAATFARIAAGAPEEIKALDAVGPDSGSLMKKFTSADLAADPVYNSGLQFGLDQGTQGINNRAVAQGGYDSGATLKALTRFGNDYGSTKANESYNRYTQDQTNIYNKLAGISGTGQVAAGQVQAAGTNAANNISDLYTQGGNARAAGIVGGANAWGGAAQNVAGAANNAYNNYNSNQTLQALLKKYNGGGSSGSSSIIDSGNANGFFS
jgi:hypothetical protein